MTSWLFTILIDKCLRIALLTEESVDLGTVKIRGFAFADDLVVMAESIGNLQSVLNKLNATTKNMGLHINVNKISTIFEEKSDEAICLRR